MTKSEKIRLYYGIFLSLFTAAIGILFIVSAANIYYSDPTTGGHNYTREIVGEKLFALLIPVILWIAAIIAGFVLSVVYPASNGRLKIRRTAEDTLSRLRKKIPAEGDEGCMAEYRKCEQIRLIVRICCAVFCLLAAIMSAVYLLNAAHFTSKDLNGEILNMLKNVLPWIGSAFVVCCGVAVFERVWAGKELPCVKKLVAGKGALRQPSVWEERKSAAVRALSSKWTVLGVRIALAVLGVTFVFVGIFNGGAQDVLIKAINICTECIGLG